MSRFDDEDRPRSPRPRIDPKKGKHSRLRALECIDELDDRLARGYPVPEVAKWLQEEQMECGDITTESLVTTLHRYKKDLSPVKALAPTMSKIAVEAEKAIVKGVDELSWMEKLFHMQMERVEIGMKFEKQTNILNRFMNQEMALAAALLQKRHNIKMDLGFNGGRDLGTLSVRPELEESVRSRYGDEIIEVIQDPESRGRALSIAKSLAQIDGAVDLLGDE